MKAELETPLPSFRIWDAWLKAHAAAGLADLQKGKKGTSQKPGHSGFKYQIQQVVENESFSIAWKTLFVRLLFTYAVKPIAKGSKVSCSVDIKGFFAWPVRFFLANKIQKKLTQALHSMVRELESRTFR